jgi:hypothetical protein
MILVCRTFYGFGKTKASEGKKINLKLATNVLQLTEVAA